MKYWKLTLVAIALILSTSANSANVNYNYFQRTANSGTNDSLLYGARCGSDSYSTELNGELAVSVASNSVSGGNCDGRIDNVASSSGTYTWSEFTETGWSFEGDSTARVDAGLPWGSGATGQTFVKINFESDVFVNLDLLTSTTDENQPAYFNISQCNLNFTSCYALASGNGVGLESLDMSANGVWQNIGFALDAGNYRLLTRTSALASSYFSSPGEIESEILQYNIGFVSTVPVPAAVWLFGSGLIVLVGFARRKKA